jgi:hypothetical protein
MGLLDSRKCANRIKRYLKDHCDVKIGPNEKTLLRFFSKNVLPDPDLQEPVRAFPDSEGEPSDDLIGVDVYLAKGFGLESVKDISLARRRLEQLGILGYGQYFLGKDGSKYTGYGFTEVARALGSQS